MKSSVTFLEIVFLSANKSFQLEKKSSVNVTITENEVWNFKPGNGEEITHKKYYFSKQL